MSEAIEVVYEQGILRPLQPLPAHWLENQRLTVRIEHPTHQDDWLADADESVNLKAVRQALGKLSGTLAQLVIAEREER